MNDTSRQILSTNKSISTPIAKFCRLTSRFCKILSIKTLFKQKQGVKYTLFKFPKSFDSGLNRSYFDEFSPLSRTFPRFPQDFFYQNPRFPRDFKNILNNQQIRTSGLAALGIGREPAFLHPVFLLEEFVDEPEAGEGGHS